MCVCKDTPEAYTGIASVLVSFLMFLFSSVGFIYSFIQLFIYFNDSCTLERNFQATLTEAHALLPN